MLRELRPVGLMTLILAAVLAFCGCSAADMTAEQMEVYQQQWQTVAENTQKLGGEAALAANVQTQAAGLLEALQLPVDGNAILSASIDPVKAALLQAVLESLKFQRDVIDALLERHRVQEK